VHEKSHHYAKSALNFEFVKRTIDMTGQKRVVGSLTYLKQKKASNLHAKSHDYAEKK